MLVGCGIVIVGGVMLVAFGHVLPVFNVSHEQANEAYLAWCTLAPQVDHAAGARYLAMFGWHYALMNLGVLVASWGSAIGALVLALRLTSPAGRWFRTPAHRGTFIAAGIGAISLGLVGTVYGLSADLERQYFPACADSIGIPIAGLTTLTLVLIPLLSLIGLMVMLGFGTLPAPLNQWDGRRPLRSWIVTLVFAVLMLTVLGAAALSAFGSDILGPPVVVALYLLASTRAALLAPTA